MVDTLLNILFIGIVVLIISKFIVLIGLSGLIINAL